MKPPRITLSIWAAPRTNTVQMGYFRKQQKQEHEYRRHAMKSLLGDIDRFLETSQPTTETNEPTWVC